MIAKNFRKYAEALALQLPLPFGQVLKWATRRPTTEAARAVRTARGRTFAAAGRIRYPAPIVVPQWAREQRARAQALARRVRALLQGLTFAH